MSPLQKMYSTNFPFDGDLMQQTIRNWYMKCCMVCW